VTAAAVVLTLGLAGCGGADESAASSADSSGADTLSPAASSASPSAGESRSETDASEASASPSAEEGRLAGAGYSFALPEGWQDATDQFKEYSELIDAGAVNAAQAGQAFSDNVNVLRNADQTELPAAQAEEQFTDELRTVATRVRVQPTARVDGVDVLHLSGRTGTGAVTAVTDQYIAYVAGAYYVVTFSYGTGTPRPEREDEVAAMLGSWAWG
jgi:hypothetical protein